MKRFKLFTSVALSCFILTSPLHTEAKLNIDDLYEEAYDDLEKGKPIENKTERINNNEKPKIEKEVLSYEEDIELGDIVEVYGIGNSRTDGSGISSREFNGDAFAVVGIKTNQEYPYAIASVSNTGDVGHIVGWFKKSCLKSRYVEVTTTKYADAIKEIIPSDGMKIQIGMIYIEDEDRYIPEYAESFYAGIKGYRLYDDEHMIKISFDFPEPDEVYDESRFLMFDGDEEVTEYVRGDDYFYYRYNLTNGEITHKDKMRDTVNGDAKTLSKKFNIINE